MEKHYFLTPPDDALGQPDSYFCYRCGKYLTNDVHFRALSDALGNAQQQVQADSLEAHSLTQCYTDGKRHNKLCLQTAKEKRICAYRIL